MVSLRTARPRERNGLEDLQRRALMAYDTRRAFLAANPDAIALPLAPFIEERVRVAEAGGRALGFSVLLPRGERLDLDSLFVEPCHWGHGIGRALVEDAAARARAAGIALLEVLADPQAEGFYARLGFLPAGAENTLFGPANRMRMQVFPAGAPQS